MHHRYATATAGLVGFVVTLAACGSGPSHPTSAPTTVPPATTAVPATTVAPAPASTAPTTTPATAASTTTAPATTAPPATGPTTPGGATGSDTACGAGQLSVSIGPGTGGAGHIGLVVLLRNTGTTACRTGGYPGVNGLVASGQDDPAERTPSGYLGGITGDTPPTLRLQPGQVASSLVEDTDVPVSPATSCASFDAFLVTPPGTTATRRLAGGLPACSRLLVHPLVAGTTGIES